MIGRRQDRVGLTVLWVLVVTAAAGRADEAPLPAAPATRAGRYYLVPELADGADHLTPGPRQYTRRIAVSPAVGRLGNDDLFAMRLAFSPNQWLSYEISLAHNPATTVNAMLHTFSVQLRHPFPGRFQPYLSAGYGMVTVYPGRAIKADPVTKNILAFGGGLEVYVRNDVALRGELRSAVILGQYRGRDDTVAFNYPEYTFGLVFYRGLGG